MQYRFIFTPRFLYFFVYRASIANLSLLKTTSRSTYHKPDIRWNAENVRFCSVDGTIQRYYTVVSLHHETEHHKSFTKLKKRSDQQNAKKNIKEKEKIYYWIEKRNTKKKTEEKTKSVRLTWARNIRTSRLLAHSFVVRFFFRSLSGTHQPKK